MSLQQIGIVCDQNRTRINGTFRYEGPINLTLENEFQGECFVGAFTYINPFGKFSNTRIGRYCSLAEWITTGPGQHSTNYFSTHPFIYDPEDNTAKLGVYDVYKKILGHVPPVTEATPNRSIASPDIIIGNDVWIGLRVIIMSNVKIGDGAVIAAGAVVTKDVEPYTIVGGVPARPIRKRFDDATIEKLLKLRWWDYDMSQVSNRVNYGNPNEVIDFMNAAMKEGSLRQFPHSIVQIKRDGDKFNITQQSPHIAQT